MNLKEFFTDDDAVSPVIGVILMVAITVILAAVIGTFVLNLGDNLQSTSPTASFSFDEGDLDDADSDIEVKITHDGGDTIPEGNLKVTVNGNTAYTNDGGSNEAWSGTGSDVSAGTTVTLASYDDGPSEFTGGETVRVVWESDDGSNSQTLDSYEVQG